jgi:pyruvate/2-oxoglutarate dehydrogenase complex dihydrolipoamide acyltransferase (E2) component
MEDHLATFLIAAGPNCYIGCGQWKFEGASDLGEYGSGLEFIDNAWVDRQLGPPQSDGMYDAATKTWHRRFRSGTNVSFDVGSNTGHIEWAAGPAPPPPPGPSPPPSPSPSPAPPHPASACARELAAHCNASAGKIACEACCKAEIKALQKRSGLLCTKADRDALCKKHKKHKTDDDDAAAAAAAAAPPRPKKYNIIHLNTV